MLEAKKNRGFVSKIDPEALKECIKKHPDHTLAKMKQNPRFEINAIWYRLK